MKWKVGQKIWFVPRYGEPYEETVTKVGRKWAYLGGEYKPYRIDNDGVADGAGYTSPGNGYESREKYEKESFLRDEFLELRTNLGYTPNNGVTLEDIKAAKRLLRI